jgi:ribosomal protein S1
MEKQNLTTQDIEAMYPISRIITGKVIRHLPFGIFLDIGSDTYKGLIPIIHFLDEGRMTPDQYPKLETMVKAIIIGYVHEEHTRQVYLSVKPSLLKYHG